MITNMSSIKNIFNWIVKSSEDPKKLSMTLKGAIPFVIIIAGWKGLDIDQQLLNTLIDDFVVGFVMIITGLQTFYGLARKVNNTIKAK